MGENLAQTLNEEEKEKLSEELDELIFRNFGLGNKLSNAEIGLLVDKVLANRSVERKLFVVIKTFELLVEGVDLWTERNKAEASIKEWTKCTDYPEGLTEKDIERLGDKYLEFKYTGTQIIETSVKN